MNRNPKSNGPNCDGCVSVSCRVCLGRKLTNWNTQMMTKRLVSFFAVQRSLNLFSDPLVALSSRYLLQFLSPRHPAKQWACAIAMVVFCVCMWAIGFLVVVVKQLFCCGVANVTFVTKQLALPTPPVTKPIVGFIFHSGRQVAMVFFAVQNNAGCEHNTCGLEPRACRSLIFCCSQNIVDS